MGGINKWQDSDPWTPLPAKHPARLFTSKFSLKNGIHFAFLQSAFNYIHKV